MKLHESSRNQMLQLPLVPWVNTCILMFSYVQGIKGIKKSVFIRKKPLAGPGSYGALLLMERLVKEEGNERAVGRIMRRGADIIHNKTNEACLLILNNIFTKMAHNARPSISFRYVIL